MQRFSLVRVSAFEFGRLGSSTVSPHLSVSMNTFVFLSLLCCAVSALTVAGNEGGPAKMPTASQFYPPTPVKPTTASVKPTLVPVKPTTAPVKPTAAPVKPTTAAPVKTTAAPVKPTTAAPVKPTTAAPVKPTLVPVKPTTAAPRKPTTAAPVKPTAAPVKPTTAAPRKPTTAAPPQPPKPTPPTTLTVGNYTVQSQDKKTVCLKAQMALQLRLGPPKANSTFIVQPNITKAAGYCQETKANLTLLFKEGHITFMFNKSVSSNTVYVDSVDFKIIYPLNKTHPDNSGRNASMHLFSAKIGNSYSCREESVFMGNNFYLDVSKDRIQAFNFSKSNDFGFPDHCPADQPDYRIPVAVGLTLLVLILIVLVAYLLGRRKRSDGYQTL
ncbi:macrosialin-like [Synchiropus splendidus]|uniref:macrosialin-like n=1 Tax=Synchiropus splendidus TaxID=270530 RepID=UPI00237EC76A|nr:macrosialin-like [Synchiropus splendidus]